MGGLRRDLLPILAQGTRSTRERRKDSRFVALPA
jgi:hypothetical protein